jgi:hypothetical protein
VKVMLAAVIVLAVAILLWAVVLYFARRPEVTCVPKERWLEDLERLMKLNGGTIVPSHLAGAAHAIASSLEKLSEKIEKLSESTERLGKINLVLVWVIAVATVAYTVAAWLQVARMPPAK